MEDLQRRFWSAIKEYELRVLCFRVRISGFALHYLSKMRWAEGTAPTMGLNACKADC